MRHSRRRTSGCTTNGADQMIHHFSSDNVPFTMRPVLDRSGIMFMMMEEVPGGPQH